VTPRLSVVIPTHDNVDLLRRCLASWQRFAHDQPVELLVVDDGSTDGTADFLAEVSGTPWGGRTVRALREEDVHELMCTNRGMREARAPLVMTWHDDMFLQASWVVPELVRTFAAYPQIGMLTLSRGLLLHPAAGPPETFEESVDWSRLESTIGPAPLNWARIHEVDAVMRPWVLRRACLERVGLLDEAFRPTEWDESDLAYRIRAAGWAVATHGYERDGAFRHLVSSTYGRSASDWRKALGLRNARLFWERWGDAVNRDAARRRRTWRRRAGPAGWLATAAAMLAHAVGRGQAS
jgi:GT2 family glycosyltransferase